MSAIAIIPARGGSRRIPRKNIKLFHGKPIIAYSIETAKESGLFGVIVVSSEDKEIGQIAMEYGAVWTPRSFALAGDEVGTQEVTRDVLQTWDESQYEYACCIYPCAPLIRGDDLRTAYQHAYQTPYNYVYAEGQFYFGIAQRFIDSPTDFSSSLKIQSLRYIDINTPEDWTRAEEMYAALHKDRT